MGGEGGGGVVHHIVTVAVSRDRKSRTALSANEIIGFVPVTFSEKK